MDVLNIFEKWKHGTLCNDPIYVVKKGVDQSFNYRHEQSLLNRTHRLNTPPEVSLTNQIIFQIFLAASSNPFGAAKAVDTSAKEKEIEQKLKETTISDNPKHKKEFVKKVSDRFYSSFIEIQSKLQLRDPELKDTLPEKMKWPFVS